MQKYYNIIHKSPLFEGIAPDDIPVLLNRLGAYVKSYQKNEYIKLVGAPADFIGIVLAGNIQIVHDDYYGNRSITATFSTGSLFGEAFACAGIDYLPVDILSCDNTQIMLINSSFIFTSRCGECKLGHTIICNLLKIVASKNMLLNQKLQCISHKTTSEKILAYLNSQAKFHNSTEFTIPFNRQGLADYLGVDRSAMSAEISRLVKLGIIETRRSYFKLLRP